MIDSFSHQDMLGFMDDDERQYYESPERTKEERDQIRAQQEQLWNLIPTPTEDQLQPPYMHANDWDAHKRGAKDVLSFFIRKWKRERKATARAELEHSENKPESRDERSSSSTRSELDSFWKPIDEINRSRAASADIPEDLREILGIPRTAKEQRDVELFQFMPPQLRSEYDKADAKRRAVLWEANERNFEAAQKREEQRLRQYQDKTEKTLDMLHRIKEDPSKAHLLPPDDASMDDLHKWHDEISKPERIVPFPGEGGYTQAAKQNEDTSRAPFDLATFDPSNIDLSHLDWRERNRIKARQYDSRELSLLLQGQNPWTKSGKPKPLPSCVIDPSHSAHSAATSEPPPAKPKPYTQPKRVTKQERAKLLRGEPLQQPRHHRIEAPTNTKEVPTYDRSRFETTFRSRAWNEIVKHKGWYIVAFLLGTLPVGIGTIWPALTHETVPEWLADHGWPRLTTLITGWLSVAAIIAVVITFRALLSARTGTTSPLTKAELDEVRRERDLLKSQLDSKVILEVVEGPWRHWNGQEQYSRVSVVQHSGDQMFSTVLADIRLRFSNRDVHKTRIESVSLIIRREPPGQPAQEALLTSYLETMQGTRPTIDQIFIDARDKSQDYDLKTDVDCLLDPYWHDKFDSHSFLRIKMEAVGQRTYCVDLDADWEQSLKNEAPWDPGRVTIRTARTHRA